MLAPFLLVSQLVACVWSADHSYDTTAELIAKRLGPSSGYNPAIRPLLNQSQTLYVNVSFTLLSIVEVVDAQQKMFVNGFAGFSWRDEKLAWDYDSNYTQIDVLFPEMTQIWLPKVFLTNTMGAGDLFHKDYYPLALFRDGRVSWNPGGLIPVSCELDLIRYPFDRQECGIVLTAVSLSRLKMAFRVDTKRLDLQFNTKNGMWVVEKALITIIEHKSVSAPSSFVVTFHLKRRPRYIILNMVTPIMLVSLLNVLVFVIPARSGESIGFSVSILLSLTVFMSIISDHLPKTSESVPRLTIYLLVVTILSVCTVAVSIVIVYCHNRADESEGDQPPPIVQSEGDQRPPIVQSVLVHSLTSKPRQTGPEHAHTVVTGDHFAIDQKRKKHRSPTPSVSDSRGCNDNNGNGDVNSRPTSDPDTSHPLQSADSNARRSLDPNPWRTRAHLLNRIAFGTIAAVWIAATIAFFCAMLED